MAVILASLKFTFVFASLKPVKTSALSLSLDKGPLIESTIIPLKLSFAMP
jgi:hypothetical protein